MSQNSTDGRTTNLNASEEETQSTVDSTTTEARRSNIFTIAIWKIVSSAPTLLVLIALLGIGFWGHHTGWKIPKFSQLTSESPSAGIVWCEEHGVAESECIACNADLMPKGKLYGWCNEHGVHECVLHHPDIAQLRETPEILQPDIDRTLEAISLRPRPKNDRACQMHLRRIQFPSSASADKAGIDIALVDRGHVVETISAPGEIVYDPTRVVRLSSRVEGTVWRVEKSVGDRVEIGEVVALIDAAEVGKAKADLLNALAQVEFHTTTVNRIKPLFEKQVITGSRMLEAEAALQQAEIGLRSAGQALGNLGLPVSIKSIRILPNLEREKYLQFLGLTGDLRAEVSSLTSSNNLIPIVSSLSGVVTHRTTVSGEFIKPSQILLQVADTSRMWLLLDVALEDAGFVSRGQAVRFRTDGDAISHLGNVTWISTEVGSETRTIKIRGELTNVGGALRNESFGRGEVILREEEDAVLVPSSAVHWEGCCHVVFVRDKNYLQQDAFKVFHTRSVRPGIISGDYTEMLAGVLPGEVIVTKGSGVLRSELLKGNLGAG